VELLLVAAVIVIAGLIWWLNRVRTERDDALAELYALRLEHLRQCHLVLQRADAREQLISNAQASVARYEGNDPIEASDEGYDPTED
jgi:hypothetical protein